MSTQIKTGSDSAWEELCAASTSPEKVVASVHPFLRTMGAGPYHFDGMIHVTPEMDQEKARCVQCNKKIKNVYVIRNAAGEIFSVGSECVLALGNGFSAHLVGQVKIAKKRYDKERARNRKREKRDGGLVESRKLFPQEMAFLDNYRGSFEFYISLKNQLNAKGGLSDSQWASVTKAVKRDAEFKAAEPTRTYTLAVGTTLIVSKFIAFKIGEQTGLNRPHFAIEVVEVKGESEKAYKIVGKLSAHRTSRCCVCGLTLKNSVSVVAGIGPICADRFGVSTTEELQAKLMTEYKTQIELWVPKSQIKERKVA